MRYPGKGVFVKNSKVVTINCFWVLKLKSAPFYRFVSIQVFLEEIIVI